MRPLSAEVALALATARDRLLRPAGGVGVLILGSCLALLPRLGNPAAGLQDNAKLAIELAVSSTTMCAAVIAAVLAVDCVRPDHGGFAAPETLVSPHGLRRFTVGSWGGAVGAALAVTGAAAAVGALGWIGSPEAELPRSAAPWVALGVSWVLGSGLAAAAGLLAAAWAPRVLAYVVVSIFLAVSRAATSAGWTWPTDAWLLVIPDPARLDCAREFAYLRPVSWEAVAAAGASAVAQTVALLLLGALVIRSKMARGMS